MIYLRHLFEKAFIATHMCHPISPKIQVAATLYYLPDTRGMRKVANSFGISPCDRGQIGIKLGTEHVIYQMLANFK